ncbi:hypothetical protein ABEB22_16750 (plasmid) [Thioclava sp. 'Guangxiensis']|uniref:hypothetical protein n=1 Tax=Thioclava sp. 'Guangxiensis' TaxID=3149044 RepID=UPI0032C494B7
MAGKREKPEDIVMKLRQVEVCAKVKARNWQMRFARLAVRHVPATDLPHFSGPV